LRTELIYLTAGGGHLASARALAAGISRVRPGWSVRTTDLFKVLDPENQFRRFTGSEPSDFYNTRLARGWTLGMAQELKALQFGIALMHERFTGLLAAHWRHSRPQMVVSLVPNFNRAMYHALRQVDPAAHFVTLLTDLADCPPRFWIERDQVQDLICGAGRAPHRRLPPAMRPSACIAPAAWSCTRTSIGVRRSIGVRNACDTDSIRIARSARCCSGAPVRGRCSRSRDSSTTGRSSSSVAATRRSRSSCAGLLPARGCVPRSNAWSSSFPRSVHAWRP
jgi:hypothetical protein